jgi:hypothetical protein
MKRFFSIFRSAKILPSSSDLDITHEESISVKQNCEFDIPSPSILLISSQVKKNNITSFYSSYDYVELYTCIYKLLLPYDPYFDRYEHYWLIVNKTYKIHTSIKISLRKMNDNEFIVDCYSMDKDDIFWKIYHLLKKKCNNVKKDKLIDSWNEYFDEI